MSNPVSPRGCRHHSAPRPRLAVQKQPAGPSCHAASRQCQCGACPNLAMTAAREQQPRRIAERVAPTQPAAAGPRLGTAADPLRSRRLHGDTGQQGYAERRRPVPRAGPIHPVAARRAVARRMPSTTTCWRTRRTAAWTPRLVIVAALVVPSVWRRHGLRLRSPVPSRRAFRPHQGHLADQCRNQVAVGRVRAH